MGRLSACRTPRSSSPVRGPPTLVPVPEIAAPGIVVTKVHQLLREHQLLAVRVQGVLRVPAEFIDDGLWSRVCRHHHAAQRRRLQRPGDDRLAVHRGGFAARAPDRRASGEPRPRGAPAGAGRRVLTDRRLSIASGYRRRLRLAISGPGPTRPAPAGGACGRTGSIHLVQRGQPGATSSSILDSITLRRTGAGDDCGQPLDPSASRATPMPASSSASRPGRRQRRPGRRQQQGPLALDQVVAGRFAGDRRVAVHAEQVVPQLERRRRRPRRSDRSAATVAARRRRPARRPGAAAVPRCRRPSCTG